MAQKTTFDDLDDNREDMSELPWKGGGPRVVRDLLKRKNETTPDYLDLKRRENYAVFVYGTLKKDGRLHRSLEGYPYLGEAHTVTPSYKMYDSGSSFPVIFGFKPDDQEAHFIHGEVYVVDEKCIAELDMIEGNGYMYDRRERHVFLEDQMVKGSDGKDFHPSIPAFFYEGRRDFWDPADIERLRPRTVNGRTMYVWENKSDKDFEERWNDRVNFHY